MEDFFARAMVAAVCVALASGPLGCFVVWRRMAYFGATLAHSALLGVALGFLLGIDLTTGILATCVAMATLLALLERQRFLAADTLLGVLAHVALAAGLVLVAFMERVRVDLMSYLFGDVLAVSVEDLWLIGTVTAAALAVLGLLWRSLLSITVNEDLAAVEGVRVGRVRLAYVVLLAAVVAVGMKVVGMLLIVSLLIVPAAAARRMTRSPETMAMAAAAVGTVSAVLGLLASLEWDVPSGPMIVLVAAALFGISALYPVLTRRFRPRSSNRPTSRL